tara:strand:- start:332 stop:502 length:171 start_codon:yes stop_codon:yes gene_type:complete
MNITSAQYMAYQGNNTCIRIVLDGVTMHVPLEEGNRHYDEIMKQVQAKKLTIADAD